MKPCRLPLPDPVADRSPTARAQLSLPRPRQAGTTGPARLAEPREAAALGDALKQAQRCRAR
jgi:hypothetical protein